MSQKVIDKILKLLELAKSPNEAEAIAAANKAQQLMLAHDLGVQDIAATQAEDTSGAVRIKLPRQGKLLRWEMKLINAVSKVNMCQMTWQSHQGFCQYSIWGKPHRVEIVKSIFDYLKGSVKAVASQAVRDAKTKTNGNYYEVGATSWRKYGNDFRLGMALRIADRLLERFSQQQRQGIPDANVSAIVVVDAFKKAMNEIDEILGNVTTQSMTTLRVSDGFSKGKSAGDEVCLDDQINAATSKRKALQSA